MRTREVLALLLTSCGAATPPARVTPAAVVEAPARVDPCEAPVTALRGDEGFAPFYRQMLHADGIPVLASARTSEAALRAACRITRFMTALRPDVRRKMIARGARVAVMARDERTLDVPEHGDLQRVFPGTDWNTRSRGLGATVARPATSCAEENLLCEATDRYRGENILVHELAHGIFHLGVVFAIPDFPARLERAFRASQAAGRWARTYAATNVDEYFAEGAQSYFDTNLHADPPNGVHNHVHTREALRAYDPALYALLAEVFPTGPWTPRCP